MTDAGSCSTPRRRLAVTRSPQARRRRSGLDDVSRRHRRRLRHRRADHRPPAAAARRPRAAGHQDRAQRGLDPVGPGRHRRCARPGRLPEEHLHDTLVAGCGVCDVEAVTALVHEGTGAGPRARRPRRRVRPRRRGRALAHPRGRPPPRPHRRTPAGTPRARRSPGRSSPRCDRVQDDPGIEVIEHALVVDLLQDNESRVCGVTLHVIGEGQIDGVGAAMRGPSCWPRAAWARSTPRRPTPRSRRATAWRRRCGQEP